MSEDVNKIVVEEPYGFIYVTTNMINGKRYLGRRKFSEDWRWYYGSGAIFKKAMKKYGKENFKRDIIDIAYSEDELNQKEYEYSIFFNVVESDDWYNLVYGGGTTIGYHASDETKRKIGDKAKERLVNPENHPMYGKDGLKGEKNPMYGISPKERMDEETYKQWYKKQKEHFDILRQNSQKKVYCIEYDRYYDSISIAKKETGAQTIALCCNGERVYSGKDKNGNNLHWLWAENVNQKNIDISLKREREGNANCKRVLCIDTETIYPSAKETANIIGCSSSNICDCCRGVQKHAKGLSFRYATEEEYKEYKNKLNTEGN